MSTLAIVLIVAAVIVVVLLVAATIAVRRRTERDQDAYTEHLAAADHALEAARASDRGWDRAVMEDVARAALAERKPGREYPSLDLILVDDRPGVNEDRAHFEARDGDERVLVVLSRGEAGWIADEVR
jgi:type II secretory pathway pseudopilin PulG